MKARSFRQEDTLIEASELVLNDSGRVYHLDLAPEDISDTIILVGDPGRVEKVSGFFDTLLFEGQHREFHTRTGLYKNKRITVLSTGIGTDNIDIVLNELDALVNIDLKTRKVRSEKKSLNLLRIGTSGALQEDIEVDIFVLSTFGLGLDAVMNFYDIENNQEEEAILEAFISQTAWSLHRPYLAQGSEEWFQKLSSSRVVKGITATANGFYGPQGRQLRLTPAVTDLNKSLREFSHKTHRITNFEMETSALYGLAGALGHKAATICVIIANRYKKEFSSDYERSVEDLIAYCLERV